MSGFYFHDGSVAENINELLTLIKSLPREITSIHVGAGFNHFADWIEHSLKNKYLADKLRTASSIDEVIIILEQEITPPENNEHSIIKEDDDQLSVNLDDNTKFSEVNDFVEQENSFEKTSFDKSTNSVLEPAPSKSLEVQENNADSQDYRVEDDNQLPTENKDPTKQVFLSSAPEIPPIPEQIRNLETKNNWFSITIGLIVALVFVLMTYLFVTRVL